MKKFTFRLYTTALFLGLMFAIGNIAWGQTSVTKIAGAGTTAYNGSEDWSNPARITSNDNLRASIDNNASATSDYLQGRNFGFSIPTNAVINGIQLTIDRYTETGSLGQNKDAVVSLIKGGTIAGDNKASGNSWPGTESTASYGNSTDLWGNTWTPSDINSSNFGVALSVNNTNWWSSRDAFVDYMQITVYYTILVPPNCAVLTYPANSATGVERNPNFSWNSAPTATGYKFYLGTGTGNYNLVNGVLLTATSYTYGSLLTAGTGYYWKVVPYNAAGDATGCTERNFTTGEDVVYCNSQGTSQAVGYISNIAVGVYSKASGSSGYTDFTTEIIPVDNISNPPFTLTPSSVTNDKYWAVWVDFNGDGDYTDSGEEVYSGYSKTAPSGTLSNIAGKVVNTTMRIAMKGDPGSSDLTVPGGMITAEYTDSPVGEDITKLIDNSTATKYLTNSAGSANYVWVQYQFPNSEKYVVTKYSMTSANDSEERDPLSWTLQGSNNGTSWTTIDTRTNEDFATRFLRREFTCTNTTAYNYYRLDMRSTSSSMLQLAEWELFGISMPTPCETFAFGEVEDYTVNIGPTCSNPTAGGTIGDAQSICSGSDPAKFNSTAEASDDYIGTLEYKWQYSASSASGPWTDIASSNNIDYDDATTLTADRWYRRLARVTCKSEWVPSNVLKVTVNTIPNFTYTKTDPECFGANDGTITVNAGGGSGSYEYSKDGGANWQTGNVFSGLGHGSYTIQVKDSNGCIQPNCN